MADREAQKSDEQKKLKDDVKKGIEDKYDTATTLYKEGMKGERGSDGETGVEER